MHLKGDGKICISKSKHDDMEICSPDYFAVGPVKIRYQRRWMEKKVILHFNYKHIVLNPRQSHRVIVNSLSAISGIAALTLTSKISTFPKRPQRYAINVSLSASLCLIDLTDWAAGGFPLLPSN